MPTFISGSTGISGTDGTASVPAIQGATANTGQFFPAANTIAWATGGVERMRVTANGNIGIGQAHNLTNTRLVVAGQSAAGDGAYATGVGSIVLNETGRASVNDVGGLEFKTSVFGAGYGAKIIALDNGALAIANRDNSATYSERMRIDASGRITKPAQPAFNATIPYVDGVNATNLWPNNNANFVNFGSVHLNRGGHFNATNGRFTAPIAGAYMFCSTIAASSGNTNNLNDYSLAINDTVNENYSPPTVLVYSSDMWQVGALTAVLNLNVNDYVTVRRGCCNNNKAGAFRMNFTGFLIG